MGERQLYTLDQLAAGAGMTARNVRAYQTRGLLPPPVRDGRTAVYDTRHLKRLVEVRLLREAKVPLRLILQSLARGEDLGPDGPLHTWATTGHGDGAAEPDRSDGADEWGWQPLDPPVLQLAEQAVPGIRECLLALRLLVLDRQGPWTVPALADLLVRLPSIAGTHPQVLDVISAAGRLAESVRGTIAPQGPGGPLGRELHELAQVAAVIVGACLTRSAHDGLSIDLRAPDQELAGD